MIKEEKIEKERKEIKSISVSIPYVRKRKKKKKFNGISIGDLRFFRSHAIPCFESSRQWRSLKEFFFVIIWFTQKNYRTV